MRHLLFGIMSVLLFNRSYAQVFDSSLLVDKSKTRNSVLTAYFLTDSFSKVGDSVQASIYLMRLNPFYLLFQGVSPTKLDSFLSGYTITLSTKRQFKQEFEKVYRTSRNAFYTTFERMYEVDQEVRGSTKEDEDSIRYAQFERRLGETDSVHSDYLYKYVKKYGWPKLEDGGLYAQFLALHEANTERLLFYLPYMKKEVLQGTANYNIYNTLLNRAQHPPFLKLAKNYKSVQFDVSYILKLNVPTKLQEDEIKKAVKSHAPIKYIYFLYKSNNEADFKAFIKEAARSKQGYHKETVCYWNAFNLLADLEDYQINILMSDFKPFYKFDYEDSYSKNKKLILYLFY